MREEVVVRKDASDRTETVKDTVRRTEVEVEEDKAGKGTASGATAPALGSESGERPHAGRRGRAPSSPNERQLRQQRPRLRPDPRDHLAGWFGAGE